MKADLIKHLETLSKPDVHIVKIVTIFALKEGDSLIWNGEICKFVRGHHKRTLTHMVLVGSNGYQQSVCTHQWRFTVLVIGNGK